MKVNWNNIDPDNGWLYVIGYAPNYSPSHGPLWWIAGTGVTATSTTGEVVIQDGAFGNPGDYVEVFVCQSATPYFSVKPLLK